jgi:probable lipoprotein NlpC
MFLLAGLFPPLFAAAPLASAGAQDARNRVIAAAEKYQGVKYRYGGLDSQGFDCSGFVYRSFRDALSVSVPRTTGGIHSWVEKIPDAELEPGDLLFFKTTSAGTISHVGIYTGKGRFIHAASDGPRTGVIYSELSENYWHRTYAGAGRALPQGNTAAAALAGAETGTASAKPDTLKSVRPDTARPDVSKPVYGDDSRPAGGETAPGRYRIGFGMAPSWNGFLEGGFPVRGGAAQIRAAAETRAFSRPVLLGLELRPEWDGALNVFRLPVTISAGFDDRFRLFIGPAFSFGDAVLTTPDGDRHYSGGTAWIGALGISAAPFSWTISRGTLAVYGEFAWQSYFSDNSDRNMNADICAGLRFSTGLVYTWNL